MTMAHKLWSHICIALPNSNLRKSCSVATLPLPYPLTLLRIAVHPLSLPLTLASPLGFCSPHNR